MADSRSGADKCNVTLRHLIIIGQFEYPKEYDYVLCVKAFSEF